MITSLEQQLMPYYIKHRKKILSVVLLSLVLLFCSALYVDDTGIKEEHTEVVSKEIPLQKSPVQKQKPSTQSVLKSNTEVYKDTSIAYSILPLSATKNSVTKSSIQKQVVVTEKEDQEIQTVQQYVYHNTITRAVPKQYSNGRILGKQVLTPKSPEVRIQLLEPLMLATITLPKGTFVNGVTHFDKKSAAISVSMVNYKGKNYPVELIITDALGRVAIPTTRKHKLKLENTSVIVETK